MMKRVAYVYLRSISRVEAVEILKLLAIYGFRVTRIGKSDRPKKQTASIEDAVSLIIRDEQNSITNWTFIEDNKSRIGIDFAIRNDPRWGFSTVSISFPDTISAQVLCDEIVKSCRPFACISGFEELGKEQDWDVVIVSDDCPEIIREKLNLPR